MIRTMTTSTFGPVFSLVLGLAAIGAGATPGLAQDGQWIHATSLTDTPKYPEGFAQFDYVNPDAPKGGTLRLSTSGTFDSLNFVPPKGSTPDGLGLIYDTLMQSSMDEISTEYGLLADALRYPADYSSVTYRLRDGARWHDGEPVTAEDVVFSFNVLVEHNPSQAFYYRHVKSAEVTAPNEVTFTFDETGNRELPHIVGQLLILPKHYWEGTDASGKQRDIADSTLEVPLGSGPYRIKSLVPGRTIAYERVDDYWGKDLNVNVGANNFDEVRYEFFRDDTVEMEAFKADKVDFRIESTARVWATGYDFPALRDGRVVREIYPNNYRTSGIMAGFVFNLNRPVFQDPRVRRAFNLAMPFEAMNETLFFGQYRRIDSYFYGSELATGGLPEGREREILAAVREKYPDDVPEAVLTETYTNPVSNAPAEQRDNLRQALQLLNEAGWKLQGNQLVGPDGKPMAVEYLTNNPAFERIALRYQPELAKIGIKLNIRTVDAAQYENRVRSRDYDLIYAGWAQSLSPGNEQLDFFGSNSADRPGSRNYGAIRNPAIDEIIRTLLQAKDRDELVAATKALDRVLLWNNYVVPGWTLRADRVAMWDRFGHPDPLPEYALGFPTIWWWDDAKAAATAAKR